MWDWSSSTCTWAPACHSWTCSSGSRFPSALASLTESSEEEQEELGDRIVQLDEARLYQTHEKEGVTLHVEPELSGEVGVFRDDDLTEVASRVGLLGVVDVQGDVR